MLPAGSEFEFAGNWLPVAAASWRMWLWGQECLIPGERYVSAGVTEAVSRAYPPCIGSTWQRIAPLHHQLLLSAARSFRKDNRGPRLYQTQLHPAWSPEAWLKHHSTNARQPVPPGHGVWLDSGLKPYGRSPRFQGWLCFCANFHPNQLLTWLEEQQREIPKGSIISLPQRIRDSSGQPTKTQTGAPQWKLWKVLFYQPERPQAGWLETDMASIYLWNL